MRISDWSSDVCSSDLGGDRQAVVLARRALAAGLDGEEARHAVSDRDDVDRVVDHDEAGGAQAASNRGQALPAERDVEEVGGEEGVGGAGENGDDLLASGWAAERSEEHTSELQSLMRISYAVFCLTKQIYQI